MLIYALLHLTGYAAPTLDDIRNFRKLGSPCAGHPENFELEGIECTTGPLGQGLAMAVGMALAERHLNATFGTDLVDHRTWVVAGDGCLMEGLNHEAIGLAGHLGLGRMIVLWDNNHITIDGGTELSTSEDIPARFRSAGWHTEACDGHDPADIERAIAAALADPRPSLVACRTIIGKGAPTKQGTHAVHGAALGAEEIAAARIGMGWTSAAFEIPAEILADWRALGAAGATARAEWEARLAAAPNAAEFSRRMRGDLPDAEAHGTIFADWLAKDQTVATRKASELALEVADPAGARNDRRIGRSDRLEQHQDQGNRTADRRRLRRALCLLGHPRIRHGGSNERHGAARRSNSLWRHVPGVLRLLPQRHPHVGAPARAGDLRADARFDRPGRRRPDASAGRACHELADDPQPRGVPPLRHHRDRRMLDPGAAIG